MLSHRIPAGFLFLDAFLSWSPRRLLGIWASHFPNSGQDQTKGPPLYLPQIHLGGEGHLAWQTLIGPRESRTAWPSILFPSIYLKDRHGSWGGATRSPGNSCCRKRAWPKHQSLKMAGNCNLGPHFECWVPQFPDFIVLNFDCWWLSDEGTSGEHLSMESRKDGEGPAPFSGGSGSNVSSREHPCLPLCEAS